MTHLNLLNYKIFVFYVMAFSNAVLPLSFDVFFVAQESIAASLGITSISIGKIQAMWSLGVCIGQLVCGPLIDKYGRKIFFSLGMALLFCSSIVSFQVVSISTWLGINTFSLVLLMRFLQGVGLASQLICSKAIINDLFPDNKEKSIRFSSFISYLLLFAVLAPLMAGAVLVYSSWETLFLVLAVASLIVLLCLYWIPETLTVSKNHQNISYWDYLHIFKNTQYVGYMLTNTLAFVWIFTSLFVLPTVVVQHLGFSPQVYGVFSAIVIIVSIIGSVINQKLLKSNDINTLINKGSYYILIINLLLLVLALCNVTDWWIPVASDLLGKWVNLAIIATPIFIGNIFIAFLTINCMTGAVNSSKEHCGIGAAILGIVQFGVGSIVFPMVAILASYIDIMVTMAIVQAITMMVSIVLYPMLSNQASNTQS